MTLLDSLLVSVFGITVVFTVLIALSFFIKLQSAVVSAISNDSTKAVKEEIKTHDALKEQAAVDTGWTSGELKLIGVDEKTAAMIMAIVSDESKIPLLELQFKSIRALD
ncbi:OadG family protein [Pseudobacteroides cellulosolvens]|uniref:Sodium pump decarboxylase gamma subunit n=1 Tax=Pseudobacteroides cellulosolvens ATCC 35603 = DSM 2933 TaxID=398512 RepID=A0A0L6JHF3_9FIRM|nr:OadG family protein [Pseudobacteroides cellulosolvens]KNY25154.1 sodium pump decarboxylase gamma subunit [Pseudobacteroides cellulosolvens ATCC 35603 = DSM 2933]